MTLEYRNRSISQLVSELNSLGQAQVVLEPLRLLAIQEHDHQSLKRFKNSHGEQFFTVPNNDKRYIQDDITLQFTSANFSLLDELFGRGFNVSMMLVLPKEQSKAVQLWGQIGKWMGDAAYSPLGFTQQQVTDLVSEERLTEREIENRSKYYRLQGNSTVPFLDKIFRNGSQSKSTIHVIKICKILKDQPSYNQISLIVLPEIFFSPDLKSNDYLSVVRSQLTQIFNFIKLNPAKKYQHFSKLLTKRLPITNVVASLLLQQSLCIVVNWVNQGHFLAERFAFYDKLRGLTPLLKVQEKRKIVVAELPFEIGNSASRKEMVKTRGKQYKTERTPVAQLISEDNQLDYCRSFERKTHKYSIHGSHDQAEDDEQLFSNKVHPSQPSQFKLTSNQHSPSPVTHRSQRPPHDTRFDQTMPKQKPVPASLHESQQISILKAQHAVEISQYHHTIQQLNKKILALTHQNKLEQLYTIHQRQLMLLELKIKELRNDITVLTEGGDEKSYKAMVRKLNEQIKRLENCNAQKKVAGGKLTTLEKQIQELKSKYQESENGRKKLAYELDYLTKRLKICDAQIEHLNHRQTVVSGANGSPAVSTSKLSISDIESLRQVEVLLNEAKEGNEQAAKFLMRKLTNVLEDLSSSRNIILECNDFLVQLEEHLEEKLGSKEPQIVLDCNKFIRSFLMDNLNIF